MSRQLTHGSLFSGIGGFDLGFERAGIKTVWQVEIDPFCRKVLEKHWPNVKRLTDIRGCGGRNLSSVDVLTGGFPCQDISLAGRRGGLAGERSGLWGEMARIICEIRPQYVVVENSPGLLSPGEGFESPVSEILGWLATCGYDAEWDCLPACAFGADHIRDRIFIVAYTHRWRQCVHGWTCKPQEEMGKDVTDPNRSRLPWRLQAGTDDEYEARIFTRRGFAKRIENDFPRQYRAHCPVMGRGVHGIPRRMDRIKALGNAIVPQIAEWIGRRIVEACE